MMDRRRFLRGTTALGTAAVVGASASRSDAEPPPETTRLRLVKIPSICQAPQYVADALFQAEGFIPYGRWRDFDPIDTIRFYALRLHEAGMIKSSPQKILAQGTDWRFLNELRKELKA